MKEKIKKIKTIQKKTKQKIGKVKSNDDFTFFKNKNVIV